MALLFSTKENAAMTVGKFRLEGDAIAGPAASMNEPGNPPIDCIVSGQT